MRNEEVLSDSEYESALSTQSTRSSTPLEIPGPSNSRVPAGNEKVKKKLGRGTGAPFPFFRFPHGRVDADVDEIEGDAKQLPHVEGKIGDGAEAPEPDAHTEQELPQRPSSAPPFEESESAYQLPPAADLINTKLSSHTPPFILVQDAKEETKENKEQESQDTKITNAPALEHSLTEIRTHLTTLESAINANISAQSLKITGSSEPPVLDSSSLPSFKTEKNNPQTVGAVLGTVKVLCAVERGVEALVGVLELGSQACGGNDGAKDEEGEKGEKVERGLMEACLAKPEEVALEMQRAIVGMRRVLKMKAEDSSGLEK